MESQEFCSSPRQKISKKTHEGERMSTEIPIWVNGKIRWLSGLDKKTTCKEVVEVLLQGEGLDVSQVKDFTIMERWRKVERPLDENSKILKIWSHWGNEKKEVRLCLRRIDNEVDSGRGSPIYGNTPSLRRKRHRSRGSAKPPWTHSETLHPRRLAELGRFSKKDYDAYVLKGKVPDVNVDSDLLNQSCIINENSYNYEEIYNNNENIENIYSRKKSMHKSYHCSGTGRLHSTLISESKDAKNSSKKSTKCCSKRETKHKARNSENIEKLMKLILAQGATIQSQLQKLKEREEQIESIEQERHRERLEKNGRNYVLETYLGSLKDAEIPVETEEEKGEDSGVHTEGGSDQMNAIKKENIDHLKKNETEFDSDAIDKARVSDSVQNFRRGHRKEDWNDQLNHPCHRLHQKTIRSKSECRTIESKVEKKLKRTLSDNSLAEPNNLEETNSERDLESNNCSNSKEDSEETVELQRIQSQIEMWEKVFKINKKLEKEEENLVRLHIKIKKFKTENVKIAKEKIKTDKEEEGTIYEEAKQHDLNGENLAENEYDQNYEEMKKNLETLKSDLEQNSKEIYENFTKLIEEDEVVEQKRNCLSQLISDLERTRHEESVLNEMIAVGEKREENNNQIQPFCPDLGIPTVFDEQTFQEFGGYYHVERSNGFLPENYSTPKHEDSDCAYVKGNCLFYTNNSNNNQRTDVDGTEKESSKPKIVKISFQDQIQNCENNSEKSPKEPVNVSSGALKGILKNRKYACFRDLHNNNYIIDSSQDPNKSHSRNEPSEYYNYYASNNVDQIHHADIGVPLPPYNIDCTYASCSPMCNQPKCVITQNYLPSPSVPTPYANDLKTAYPIKNTVPGLHKPHTSVLSNSTMVKTKAVIHNDTDSSTSSDTSGLSSMYSSSPTVEEQSYILDTLV